MAYSKLYSSIVHSSLWTEPDHVRLLFVTLLAIADREGYVYGSRRGLERLANIDPDACDDNSPWFALMSGDSDSSDLLRNPENEGRRIEEVPGGFRILNFLYYRGLRNDDDRREQNKEAQRRHRAKAGSKPSSAKVIPRNPISDADADADAEKEKKQRGLKSASACSQKEVEDFCESLGLPRSDGEAMFLHWQEKGPAKVKDWRMTIRKWKSFGYLPSQKGRNATHQRPVAKSSRTAGTANERRVSQYDGVGTV